MTATAHRHDGAVSGRSGSQDSGRAYCQEMGSYRPGTWVRVYSYLFVTGLFAVALAFIVAAVSASDEDRGGYTGMAVLWGSGALAAAALLLAIERRRPHD
jgi:hypothetical protein